MPCLITTKSATKNSTRKKNNNKKHQKQNFTAKKKHFNLKAPINNVKLQSDKIITTQIYFS